MFPRAVLPCAALSGFAKLAGCGDLTGTVYSLQADDKEFVLLPGMWHILVKEAGNEQVIARVVEWLTARS